MAIPKFAPLRDYFEIGNWIRVEIDDEIYKLRLTSYDINYDDLDSISVEFSNVTKNSCTTASVQDVLNAASSISTTYNALTQQMDYTKSTNSIVKNWVYEGLDTTMTKIVNNAETQDVTMGTSGIYCRAYDDIKGDYDDCYLRIINNGMYLFTDGGKTLKTAVGKFWYNDKIVYGINAEVLVGNLLAGNQLLIGDSEGNVQITKDGIIAKNGYFDISNGNKRVIIDPKDFTKTGYIFQINNGQEAVVSIKADGTTLINADIVAKSLKLGTNKIPTTNIEGLSKVATSGEYGDLDGIPDLTVYETKSNVDEKLKEYATSGDLKAYLKTDDLSSKLGELDVAYSGDVKTTQTKDETTGLITTTNTYKDSDGKTHSYTTYTYEDSNYVLLNRESKWGNGSLGGENNLVKISKDGLLEANNAIIHGEIYASKGTFSGSLSSATGTFCGDLRVNPSTTSPDYYNFNIDKDGLKIGASDGGSRYMFTIQNDGSLTTRGSLSIADKFIYNDDTLIINGDILLKTTSQSRQSTLRFLDGNESIGGLSFNYLSSGKSSGVTLSSNGMLSLIGNSGISMDTGAGSVQIIGSLVPTDIQYPYIIDNISTLTFSSSTSVKSDNTIDLSNTYTLKSSTNKIMIIPVSTGRFNIMSTSKTQSGTTLTISMKCRNVAPSEGTPSVSCYIVEYQSKSTSTTSDEIISDEAII